MVDLVLEHSAALGFYQLGLLKQAADLHFSGKLQVDSLGDLVLDVPSALLRGCLMAVKEPGVELHLGSNWKSRIVVMSKTELDVIGGAKIVTERGKDFDYQIGQSSSSTSGEGKLWYLEITSPDLAKLRQSYGLTGTPEGGFRAIFGIRKPKLFQDGDKVRKDVPKPVEGSKSVTSHTGGYEWVLKKSDLAPHVQLQPHQQALADEISPDHPVKKLLMWQVGSGKSLGSIAASEAYGQPYTVVGPASIRPTFKSEQKKFTDQALPSSVISYQKAMKPDGIPYPDSLVVDEAQRIVNPGSQQSQAVTEAARKAKQVLLLSGTPVINRPGDIAPIMSILTDKEISPAAFEGRYLGQQARPRTWSEWLSGRDRKYDPVLRHQDELRSLLEGKVDWYAPNKPTVETKYSDHEVDMSPEQSKLYQAMFGKIPWKLRMGLDRTTDMSPAELQQLRSFLAGPRQVGLSDYPFASHGDPLKSFYGSTKLQAAYAKLKEKIDHDERTKAIVYSNFPRAGLEPYRAALMHNNIPHTLFDGSLSDAERDAAVRSFNEGRSRVALVGPAGAEGISLRGAQLLQQLDPHWNDARMQQSAARGIRFDSHADLPPELQNIEVQRFISKLPPKSRSWLQALRLSPYARESQPAADDYLRSISENKEKSNRLVLDLLKEIGTRPPREVVKTASLQSGVSTLNLPAVNIDRPKGFQKTFHTPKGPLTATYPVDYGYFDGYINPDDQEGADVFMGTGGPNGLHGRFMKGKNLSGKWEPDERKWYANLTPAEHKSVLNFYTQQDPKLLADHVTFKTHKELLDDLAALKVVPE